MVHAQIASRHDATPTEASTPAGARHLLRPLGAAVAVGALAGLATAPVSVGAAGIVGVLTATGVLLMLLGRVVEASAHRRDAADRRRATAALDALGGEHVVVHARRLPRTRLVVDHLVIGPTGVWVIATGASHVALRAETVRHQAAAVAGLSGAAPEVVRAVFVPTGAAGSEPLAADGITVARVDALTDLVAAGPAVLGPADVRRLVAALRLPYALPLAA